MTGLAAQLRDELDRSLVGPVGSLCGLDLADQLRQRIIERAPIWVAILTGDDDHETAGLVVDLLHTIHGSCDPEPAWWSTPLGRACATSLGHDTTEAWSRSVAAAVLGVHVGTVDQLLRRGKLDRHPDGGITRASVLAYLLRRRR
jgi:hypothetical protein